MLTMPTDPQSWNIPDIVVAVIADDPDAAQIAKAAGVSRASLYKSLAADAKPRFETIMKVLDAFGLQIAIVPKQSDRAQHA